MGAPAFASAGTAPHDGLRALHRSGRGRTARPADGGLAPGRDEAAVLDGRLDVQLGAGSDESVLDPRSVVAARQLRVGELELERDRFEPVAAEVDEEEQPEVVPQLRVDAV